MPCDDRVRSVGNDSAGGFGRFRDVSSGRGRVLVTPAEKGSAHLTVADHIRVG